MVNDLNSLMSTHFAEVISVMKKKNIYKESNKVALLYNCLCFSRDIYF